MEPFQRAQRALNRIIRKRPWMLLAIPTVNGGAMFLIYPYLADPLQQALGTAGARDVAEGVGSFLTVVGVIYALITIWALWRAMHTGFTLCMPGASSNLATLRISSIVPGTLTLLACSRVCRGSARNTAPVNYCLFPECHPI